jgi:ribonucleoside-diphosphate reductase alpha chain
MATGSSIVKKHLDGVKKALASFRGPEADRFNAEKNHDLAASLRAALRDQVPATYLYQLLRMLEQGDTRVNPAVFSTAWDDEAYNTVSGQSSNNSLRVTDAFMKAVIDDGEWDLTGRVTGKLQRTIKARELWDLRGPRRLAVRRPGAPVPNDGQRLAHLPLGRGDPRIKSLLGVHVPGRHSVQPGVDQPADALRYRQEGIRHRGLPPRHQDMTTILEISVTMAQFPSAEIAKLSYE